MSTSRCTPRIVAFPLICGAQSGTTTPNCHGSSSIASVGAIAGDATSAAVGVEAGVATVSSARAAVATEASAPIRAAARRFCRYFIFMVLVYQTLDRSQRRKPVYRFYL